jgi:hypothetical protein
MRYTYGKLIFYSKIINFSLNPAPTIIFARPPDVTDIKYTEATVQVVDFTLESSSDYETPSGYLIQYKVKVVLICTLSIHYKCVSRRQWKCECTFSFLTRKVTSR